MIAYFARHPTAANLLMAALLLIGLLALPKLQRETYPEFEADVIQVRASYSGADAETMDETVVARIEDVLGGLEGVEAITAEAREGSATVSVEIADGEEVESMLTEIQSAVDTISDFPSDMDEPTVTERTRTRSVVTVAVTGPMSGQDLELYLERLKRRLLAYDEITQVSIAGFSDHRLQISVDEAALARYSLDISSVASAISAQSLDTPLGELEMRGRTMLVRYDDKRVTPTQLRSIVVTTGENGAEVLLGDIAAVEDAFSVEEEQTYLNGERAGMLVVSKASTEDSLEVFAAVEKFIAEQEAVKPDGVIFTITSDTTSVIEERLALLLENGVQGLLLVFLTLWLFFDLRLAFWVAAGVPVSFLSALWVMSETGQTLNMMTMMGLLIAIGLLMDDAIVLSENVATRLRAGRTPMQAAVEGVSEVAGGVLSSFATTICVFVPLSAIDGPIGRTLQVIPMVLIAVLAMSLVEAFLILPNHLGHSLRKREHEGKLRQRFDAGFEALRERGLGRVVDFGVRHRYAAVSLAIALFLVSLGAVQGGKLRYRAFPDTEGDVVEVRLEMPAGTSLDATKREAERIVAAAREVSDSLEGEQPGGQDLVRNATVRFNYNSDVDSSGPHLATISLDLLSVEERTTTLTDFTAAWRETLGPVPNAVAANFGAGGRRGPAGNAVELRIQGGELERLDEVAEEVKEYFGQFGAVTDLADDLELGTAQVRVRLRAGVGTPGLTGSDVASQIKAALSGVSVETLYEDSQEYEVFVELDRFQRDTIADLETLSITLSDGSRVPLGSLAYVDQARSYGKVSRREGMRTVTVTGGLDRDQLELDVLMDQFSDEYLPKLQADYPDLEFTIGGELESSAETMGSMIRGAVLGLAAIFVVLSLQLRTYLEPVLVMLAIPFAFVGVVAGNLLIGSTLSSQAILGFVSLAGIVVNDSILLMIFIKKARSEGLTPIAAACSASRDRFRAVLLTSATTIAGLVPLMFESSRQAQMLIPVASSIVFGLAASTVLVLVLLPAAYVLLTDLGLLPDRPDESGESGDSKRGAQATEAGPGAVA
ncbi:efflux RND transporter permease subunit [Pseudenhygromyxa sp. WMMC2535]|uniref:efflux RND transporter permease subunit n=1 Tax=Pseudenhygromyxa sp. WMMC2535 TaxID=2712867 RepID=UPI0015569E9D|nr:efflux RND transporter permease subunit [Pseudenhygromyxa sp. WMMC2535]